MSKPMTADEIHSRALDLHDEGARGRTLLEIVRKHLGAEAAEVYKDFRPGPPPRRSRR